MNVKAQVPPDQKPEKPKSRFRLEITRHNHRVLITDSIDKGRYRCSFEKAMKCLIKVRARQPAISDAFYARSNYQQELAVNLPRDSALAGSILTLHTVLA